MVDEPQSALRIRQRHHRGSRDGPQGCEASRIAGDARGELSYRRRVEQRTHPQIGVQGGVDGDDYPHRRERIPTEIEERFVDAHALHTQHLAVDIDQNLFDRGAIGMAAL